MTNCECRIFNYDILHKWYKMNTSDTLIYLNTFSNILLSFSRRKVSLPLQFSPFLFFHRQFFYEIRLIHHLIHLENIFSYANALSCAIMFVRRLITFRKISLDSANGKVCTDFFTRGQPKFLSDVNRSPEINRPISGELQINRQIRAFQTLPR